MEFTWITIIASLCMGIGALLVFVFAVKKNYFSHLEDAKYQMFWSDVEELVDSPSRAKKKPAHAQEKQEEEDEDPSETRD
jgi:Cytochrome oxidase maturation protein cbb3-type